MLPRGAGASQWRRAPRPGPLVPVGCPGCALEYASRWPEGILVLARTPMEDRNDSAGCSVPGRAGRADRRAAGERLPRRRADPCATTRSCWPSSGPAPTCPRAGACDSARAVTGCTAAPTRRCSGIRPARSRGSSSCTRRAGCCGRRRRGLRARPRGAGPLRVPRRARLRPGRDRDPRQRAGRRRPPGRLVRAPAAGLVRHRGRVHRAGRGLLLRLDGHRAGAGARLRPVAHRADRRGRAPVRRGRRQRRGRAASSARLAHRDASSAEVDEARAAVRDAAEPDGTADAGGRHPGAAARQQRVAALGTTSPTDA